MERAERCGFKKRPVKMHDQIGAGPGMSSPLYKSSNYVSQNVRGKKKREGKGVFICNFNKLFFLSHMQAKHGRRRNTGSFTQITRGWSWRRSFISTDTSPSGGNLNWLSTWVYRKDRFVHNNAALYIAPFKVLKDTMK